MFEPENTGCCKENIFWSCSQSDAGDPVGLEGGYSP